MSNIYTDTGPGAWDHLEAGEPTAIERQRGTPPWQTPNSRAVPVFQRAAGEWDGSTVYVNAQYGAVKLVDRQEGRDWVIVSVPAAGPSGNTTPAGVYIAARAEPLMADGGPVGFLIPVGQSITLTTEGPLWAISAIGGANTFCCIATGYNL